MARARNIKPGLFKNEVLVEQTLFVRLLFIGLWTLADREGRLEDRPKRIKMELFPCDNEDVDAGLQALADTGFIIRYSSGGFNVIQIVNFLKHQTPHGTEKDSELPDSDGNLTLHERTPSGYVTGNKRNNVKQDQNNGQSPLCNSGLTVTEHPDSLNPDSLNPDSKTMAQGKPAQFDPIALKLPSCIPADAWANWIAYRRENRWSVKERTVREQIAKLEAWAREGIRPEDAIRECISNGYQGLFPPKSRGSPHSYHDERKQTLNALTGGPSHDRPNAERDITAEAKRLT